MGHVSGNTYRVNGLGSFTSAAGTYEFSVNPAFILDLAGNQGEGIGSASDTWLTVVGPFVSDVVDVSPDPRNTTVSTVNVVFSKSINLSTFTFADSMGLVSGTKYRISGLGGFTTAEGTYVLTVSAAGIQDPYGNTGVGADSDSWLMDTTKPKVVDVVDVSPDPRHSQVDSIDVVFSEPIVLSTFTYYGSLFMRRDGIQVPFTKSQ